ncbi:MAG: helical backbone metal receptor [Bacteroidia bacterium]|nr:helical backbone metal receptor [Bacteroidia bacterium]
MKLINLSLVLFLLCFTACNRNSDIVEKAPLLSISVVDDVGDTLVFKQSLQKVVSLAPNITNMVQEIGATSKLIGVSDACKAPSYIPIIATNPNLDFSSLETLQPDCIFVSEERYTKEIKAVMKQINLPVFIQSYMNLADIYKNYRVLGKLFDAESKANRIADSLQSLQDSIHKSTKGKGKPQILILLSSQPTMAVGGRGYLNDMILACNGKNVLAHIPEKYPEISKEILSKLKPDIVLVLSKDKNLMTTLAENCPEITKYPAVESNKVYQEEPYLFLNPSSAVIPALETLNRILHQ